VGYRYDAVGNREQLIYPAGQVVTYTYDAMSQLIKIQDWDGGETVYAYDGAGRILTTTLPNGITTTHIYDDAGRLVDIAHWDASGRLLVWFNYRLDGVGNRIRVAEHTTCLIYMPVTMRNYSSGGGEGAGAPPGTEGGPFASPLPTPSGGGTFVSPLPTPAPKRPSGDSSAPLESDLLLPDLTLLLVGALAAAGVIQRWKGRRWATPALVVSLTLAAAGTGAILFNGDVSSAAPRSPTVALPPASDPLEVNPVNARSMFYPVPYWRNQIISYEYDKLGRLVEADYFSGEIFEYEYDAVGNRKTYTATIDEATTVTTYTYDLANRLTSVGNVVYDWDDRGNLVSDGTFTYTYNAAGRMVQAESVTVTLVYTYNANGLRVAQSVDGNVTSFVWDWVSGIPEMLSDGDNLYLVAYETLGQWNGATWAYYLPDALGSIRQSTDAAGSVTSAREQPKAQTPRVGSEAAEP
jgi:YD repeat-containing protein